MTETPPIAFLADIAIEIAPVGSRVTCDPAPTDTDEDWLVLIRETDFHAAISAMSQAGFTLDNPNNHYRPEQSTFNSWRGPNNVNLIVTSDREWHSRFLVATAVAKRLNLLAKADRIELFQAVLYGAPGTPVHDDALISARATLFTPAA